jgi:hypothetical protein
MSNRASSLVTLRGRLKRDTEPGLRAAADVRGTASSEPESEGILPAILVAVLVLCILTVMSGMLGMLLQMVFRKII